MYRLYFQSFFGGAKIAFIWTNFIILRRYVECQVNYS